MIQLDLTLEHSHVNKLSLAEYKTTIITFSLTWTFNMSDESIDKMRVSCQIKNCSPRSY